ncbi:MAG TPA: TIGR04255 family protein [Chitinophagaceae bacterium]|nr:TIGR04255 family protein [Chitinophagaceae bacterium]
MSKLPKAPLIEVIFEIKWSVQGTQEAQGVQYLHGDLYPLLKTEYPYREAVNPHVPMELMLVHAPTHRFRTAANDYPLVQVGPGLVTVNTVDSKYFWNDYEDRIMAVLEKLKSVYTFKPHSNVHLALTYIDLLKFDFQKGDILKFLDEYLNISIKQGFYKGQSAAGNVLLVLNYPTEQGSLNLNIGRGKDNKGFDGITINTNLVSGNIKPEIPLIRDWLNKSHELCSGLFKEMTKGKLYESFK